MQLFWPFSSAVDADGVFVPKQAYNELMQHEP
jgi:hypothetical protein